MCNNKKSPIGSITELHFSITILIINRYIRPVTHVKAHIKEVHIICGSDLNSHNLHSGGGIVYRRKQGKTNI